MASLDRHGFLVVTCSVSSQCVLGPGPSETSNADATWESPRKIDPRPYPPHLESVCIVTESPGLSRAY